MSKAQKIRAIRHLLQKHENQVKRFFQENRFYFEWLSKQGDPKFIELFKELKKQYGDG